MRHLKNLQGFANNTRDVMPGNITWSSVYQDDFSGLYGYTSRRITDINQSIILGVSYDSVFGNLYYKLNAGICNGRDYTSARSADANEFTLIINGGTFSVSNLDYVDFGIDFAVGNEINWVYVTNKSDVNKTLDIIGIDYFG